MAKRFGDKWHYLISISRVDAPQDFGLYPLSVRDRLPVIPVPLAVGDGFASLDVGALVNQCYIDGAYGATLDYSAPPPPPPFSDEDAAWINALLESHGLR